MGIFAVSREELKVMRRHLRSLLQVKDYTGRQLNFRYYDPRVSRVIATCNAEDLTQVFGPISFLALEGEIAGQLLKFSNAGETAKLEQISLVAKPNVI